MDSIAAATTPQAAFDGALQQLLSMGPERALVIHGSEPDGTPVVRAAHGVQPGTVLLTGEISLETLRRVLHTGEPLQLIDAQQSDLAERNSVLLSGLRSVLVVPVSQGEEIVGLLYCDNRVKPGAFDEEKLDSMTAIAGSLSRRLAELA